MVRMSRTGAIGSGSFRPAASAARVCGLPWRPAVGLACLAAALALGVGGARAQGCYVLRPEPERHSFVLVIDRSGSMDGEPLRQALSGARLFVDRLQGQDQAAVIAFDDQVQVVHGMTTSRQALKDAIAGITCGGATALYDAMARAGATVMGEEGARIIVFLTDGMDTGSQYALADVASLGLSEGIFIYGIGLGDVDAQALTQLTAATGGSLDVTPDPVDLVGLYEKVLRDYYQTYAATQAQTGSYAIRSLPSNKEVRLAGRTLGRTPLKVDNVPVGEYPLEVVFKRGLWQCQAPAVGGHRTYIDARQDEVAQDLWVASRPHGALVFLDGAYVGATSLQPLTTDDKDWGKKVKRDPAQLRIPKVPHGPHVLRLVALPDVDFGPEQRLEFRYDMAGRERVLLVSIFNGRIEVDDGTVVQRSAGERVLEQMQELDEELGTGDEDPFKDL
ncbi:MAG: VWA domain-containing protein [Candidatus Latescibacterota bacterium]